MTLLLTASTTGCPGRPPSNPPDPIHGKAARSEGGGFDRLGLAGSTVPIQELSQKPSDKRERSAVRSYAAAMAGLATAVLARDRPTILSCFSRQKPFSFISRTVDGRSRTLRLDYAAVEKGLDGESGDFAVFFFDDESSFAQALQHGQPWVEVREGLFVPPDYANRPSLAPTGIRWRRERGSYVVDALFDSGA